MRHLICYCALFIFPLLVHAQTQPRLVLPVGHTGPILSANFSPVSRYTPLGGKFIVTASADNTARIWDVSTGKELHSLNGHTDAVISAVFSPDTKYVLTSSLDNTAIIWDASTGKQLHILNGHTSGVNSAIFSPGGKYIVTASDDNTARIWDAETGKQLHILAGHTERVKSAVFSPASSDDPLGGKYIVTTSLDEKALIWNTETGIQLHMLAGHTAFISSAAFSPNGKYVVTASNDRTARIWDASTGIQLHTLAGHSYGVWSANFSPDGKYIVTSSKDGTARIWLTSTGKELDYSFIGHTKEIYKSDFSTNSKYLLTCSKDGTARIWDVTTGIQLHTITGHTSRVISASFSPDGKYVVTASWDGTARIWDSKTAKEEHTLSGLAEWVNSAVLSPACTEDPKGGKNVLVTSDDNYVRIIDVILGKTLHTLAGHTDQVSLAVYSPNGNFVVTASIDGTIKIWSTASGKELYLLKGHSRAVTAVYFSSDGKSMLTVSGDSTTKIWDVEKGKVIHSLKWDTGPVYSAIFSPDGKTMLTITSDSAAIIWDAATGKELHNLSGHTDRINSISFSPDRKNVVTASDDATARIWDAATGKELHKLSGHTNDVAYAAFSPDGKYVVTASSDSTARIWDIATGTQLHVLKGHTRYVFSSEFSSDSKYVVTASDDHTARIWDASTGVQMHMLEGHIGFIKSATFSPDGKIIITRGIDNKLKLWNTYNGKLLYSRLQLKNGEWLVYDEDYHFDGSPGAIDQLYFTCGLEMIDLAQLKDSLWVPGLVEKIMNKQPLRINDRPAPKLSDLNICDFTPVVEGMETGNKNVLRYRITPRKGGLGTTEVYINENLTYTFSPEQLERAADTNNQIIYYLTLHTDTLQAYLAGDKNTPNPVLVKAKAKGSGIYGRGVRVEVSNASTAKTSPSFYGVFVGVNDYGNPAKTPSDFKYTDLSMAAKDADDLASAVEATARNLFQDSTHIYRLTGTGDNSPTKENLEKTLAAIGSKAKASDLLYIFFAGHGDVPKSMEEKQIRFMLHQADKNNPKSTSFGVEELSEWCHPTKMKAQKRVFVFDACHSGKFSQEFAMGRGDEEGLRVRQLDKLKDKNGMMILAASADNESAYEDETLNQGVLTYHLLQVMKTQQKDTSLVVRNWFDETIQLVEEYARSNNKEQHPNSFGDGRFEIGNVNEQVRKGIRILPPKVRVGRSILSASDDVAEKKYANLKELFNAHYASVGRGEFVFSENSQLSYRIEGTYSMSGTNLSIRYKLYYGDKPLTESVKLLVPAKSEQEAINQLSKSVEMEIRKVKGK